MEGNIIIAEDDATLRGIYEKKFTLAGYQIRTAENGQVAIQLIQQQQPDLLILDINMPVIDGFGVLQQFPKEQRAFPVILLTNFADDANKARGQQLGADDYFIKSQMTIRKLLEMVETLMKAKKYWKGAQ